MRKRKINSDKYIINMNSKYFVVNSYTFDLIESYMDSTKRKKLKSFYKYSSFKLNNEYKKLKKYIKNVDYYENNIDLDFPLKLQWKITNRCNLHCKHCYLGELSQAELSEEKLKIICDKIVKSNIMEVTITGGEALLVKSLPQIVSILIKNDIHVNIFTNAILLKNFEQKLHKLLGFLPSDMLDFFVSVDGTEKCHDSIRGKGNYNKTIDNIKYAVEKGYNVTTNTVLSKLNYKEVPKLYLELYNLGVFKIQISNIIPIGNADKKMELTKEEKNKFIEELKEILQQNNIENKLLYAEMPDEECSSDVYLLSHEGKKYLQKEQWKCSAGIGKGTVNFDGTVYCCPFIEKYSLGNIVNENFSDIWTSKKRYEFLKFIVKNNNNSRVCIATKIRNAMKGGDNNEKNN